MWKINKYDGGYKYHNDYIYKKNNKYNNDIKNMKL